MLFAPDFSPDGKWIAYSSLETNPPEVYVRRFADNGPVQRISSGGGDSPMWSRDGRQLFYVLGPLPLRVMAVDIATDPALTRSRARLLFEGPYVACQPLRCYDVSPDGTRFVAVQQGPVEPQPVTSINIVLNWFEELRQGAPAQSHE